MTQISLKWATKLVQPSKTKNNGNRIYLRHLDIKIFHNVHTIYADILLRKNKKKTNLIYAAPLSLIHLMPEHCWSEACEWIWLAGLCRGLRELLRPDSQNGQSSRNHPVFSSCDTNVSLHLSADLCGRWSVCVQGVILYSSLSTFDHDGKQSTVLQGDNRKWLGGGGGGVKLSFLCKAASIVQIAWVHPSGQGSRDALRTINQPFASSRSICLLSSVRRHFLPFLLAVVCSYLATLSCKPHPVCAAAGQTLSLRDAKDISQAIAFAAQVRYRHNWLLPATEVIGRQNDSEKKKRATNEEADLVPFPPGTH